MEVRSRTSSTTELHHDIEKTPPVEPSCFRRHQYRTLSAVAGIITVLGLSLGVGLGVGLSNSGFTPSSTSSALLQRDQSTTLPNICLTDTLKRLGGLKLAANTTPLWQPTVGSPWQIVLSHAVDASKPVKPALSVYDIDLYGTSALTIKRLHQQGIKVICYFSAGSWEYYTPDAWFFLPGDMGNNLQGWPGERWLNTESKSVRNIIAQRISLAAQKGCDAVDPDNVDGFNTDTGFPLTADTALDYLSFLSITAARHNMGIGLKNAGNIAQPATCLCEFAIIESCNAQKLCSAYQSFITANKPVFQIEYPPGAPGKVAKDDVTNSCNIVGSVGYSNIMKTRDLDGWVEYCDGTVVKTAVLT